MAVAIGLPRCDRQRPAGCHRPVTVVVGDHVRRRAGGRADDELRVADAAVIGVGGGALGRTVSVYSAAAGAAERVGRRDREAASCTVLVGVPETIHRRGVIVEPAGRRRPSP